MVYIFLCSQAQWGPTACTGAREVDRDFAFQTAEPDALRCFLHTILIIIEDSTWVKNEACEPASARGGTVRGRGSRFEFLNKIIMYKSPNEVKKLYNVCRKEHVKL